MNIAPAPFIFAALPSTFPTPSSLLEAPRSSDEEKTLAVFIYHVKRDHEYCPYAPHVCGVTLYFYEFFKATRVPEVAGDKTTT
jgi:hypothetical protein